MGVELFTPDIVSLDSSENFPCPKSTYITITTGNWCSRSERDQTLKLVEALLDTGAFNCDVCQKVWVTNVWLSSDKKNYCAGCYEEHKNREQSAVFIKNTALIKILQKLPLPCKYRKEGCQEIVQYSAYQQHLLQCPCKPFTCLIVQCSWTGTKTGWITHLCEEHEDTVLDNENCEFSVLCKRNNNETIKVLQTINGRFIARIRWKQKTLQFIIFRQDKCEELQGRFLVQFRSDPQEIRQRECGTVSELTRLLTFDSHNTTEITPNPELEELEIQLIYKLGGNRSPMPESILPWYRCWDCKKYIKTKVWECIEEHHFCENCLDATGHVCMYGTIHVRGSDDIKDSRLLNILAEDYLLPCVYWGFGCRFKIPYGSNHEASCDYKLFKCPLDVKCSVSAKPGQLLTHLKKCHNDLTVFKGAQYFTFTLSEPITCIITLDDRAFKVSYSGEYTYVGLGEYYRYFEWNVEEVGKEKTNEYYLFSIDLLTKPFTESLSVTHLCGNPVNLKDSDIKNYVSKDQICSRISIVELKNSKFEMTN